MAFDIITQLTEEQIQELHHLYQSAWWSQGREIADVRRMLLHSDVIVGVSDSPVEALGDRQTQKLVAFGRVLTDYVYRATIWDVIVDPSYRGQGLGRILMRAILNHPSLESVESALLICLPEMIPFYEKFGFANDVGKLQLMKRTNS